MVMRGVNSDMLYLVGGFIFAAFTSLGLLSVVVFVGFVHVLKSALSVIVC